MAKPRKKASPPQPPQPRIPVIGERVRRPGSDTEFEITFVSVDYRQVHIGIPLTKFEYRNVEASTLTYLEQWAARPAKPYVDVELVMEHVASVQSTALRNLAGELATLKKFLKSMRVPAEAVEELDTIREQQEEAWDSTIAKIRNMLG
jgi:hypothetical protein